MASCMSSRRILLFCSISSISGFTAYQFYQGLVGGADRTQPTRSCGERILVKEIYDIYVGGIRQILHKCVQIACERPSQDLRLEKATHGSKPVYRIFYSGTTGVEFAKHSQCFGRLDIGHTYLFQGKAPAECTSCDAADKGGIGIDIEHSRIADSLIGEEYAKWEQCSGTQPYSLPYLKFAVASHLVAGVVDYEVDDKQQNRNDERGTESAFLDDGSEWRSDEEEYENDEASDDKTSETKDYEDETPETEDFENETLDGGASEVEDYNDETSNNGDLKDETLADEISEDEVPKNEASENTENAMEYNQGDADWDNESVSEEESEEIE